MRTPRGNTLVLAGWFLLALPVATAGAGGSPATSAPSPAGETADGGAWQRSPSLEEDLQVLLSWEPYVYESLGRRDPFRPLIIPGEGEQRLSDLPDPRSLILTGVLWGEKDRFALVEDAGGRSFVLREGDPVWRGTVTRIEPQLLTIRYNHFGMWRTIRIPLRARKEAPNARER
jgi:hypothetical protein